MIILHLKSYLNVDPLDVGLFLHSINTLLKCVEYLHQHFTVESSYKLNQAIETMISLGYIFSHYNIKGGANVCIVLGK